MANDLVISKYPSRSIDVDYDVCFCYFESENSFDLTDCDNTQTYRCANTDRNADPYRRNPLYTLVKSDSEKVSCIDKNTYESIHIGTHHFYYYKKKDVDVPIINLKYAFEIHKQNNSKRSDYGQIKYVRNPLKDEDCVSIE